MKRQTTAGLAVLILTILSSSALTSGTAQGAEACKKFRPRSVEDQDVSKIPVLRVTDAATEKNPVTVEYQHGPTFDVAGVTVQRDWRLFNFLVDSRKRLVGLYVRIEWPTPSISDIDLYVYGETGKMLAWSEWFNNPVVDEAWGTANPTYWGGHGGMGYESVLGLEVRGCYGISVWSDAARSKGDEMTLKLWLGKPQVDW
ncbi:MAG: hypothetical protein ABR613_11310 [Actinomycetota bacterium]